MKVALLHLVVYGLSILPTIAMTNRLLENYERKLNSLTTSSDLIRTSGKQKMKRYRCVEEYVDEQGNVIGEGNEHITTTVAPPKPPKLWRSRTVEHHNDRNTVSATSAVAEGVTTAVRKPNNQIKLHLLKPSGKVTEKTIRRKMKIKKKKTGTTRPKPDEDNTGLLRVYAIKTSSPESTTTITTTSTVCPITDATAVTANENSDDVIMQKYFPQMQNDDSGHFAEKLPSTPSLPPKERSRALRAPQLDFMEMKSSDENQMDYMRTVPPNHHEIRRAFKFISYVKYLEYDDQSDFGDYMPYYRVKLGRRRARPYRGLLTRKYPSWQAFTRARLAHLPPPYKTEIDQSIPMASAPVMREVILLAILIIY
ncbi:hypothetical protein GCK32_006924 [Trichostrongylus colubriformis]|uniref:Uncharacterized protein n=1 Tax=Trichostrongylus colubriformis TaxID=6319 RepID=A0AAN8II30_TRICO